MAISKRYEFVYLFDVSNGNPNGDPDAGNLPRLDPETNRGLVTDVCLKRKIRNYVALKEGGGNGHAIYMQEKAVLNRQNEKAWKALEIPPDAKDAYKETAERRRKGARAGRCGCARIFSTCGAFGAVMTTEVNTGQVRGPVQIAFATSIDPIVPLEISITRMAVDETREIWKRNAPWGASISCLMACTGHTALSPRNWRSGTEFSADDLELLWEALENMFEHDRSGGARRDDGTQIVCVRA